MFLPEGRVSKGTVGSLGRFPLFDVTIDFDEASRLWRANKTKIGGGSFRYVCGATRRNGKICKRHPRHRVFHVCTEIGGGAKKLPC